MKKKNSEEIRGFIEDILYLLHDFVGTMGIEPERFEKYKDDFIEQINDL